MRFFVETNDVVYKCDFFFRSCVLFEGKIKDM